MPSITGREASGPMSPSPSTARAVRHDGDDLGLPGVVVDQFGLLGDGAAHLGDAGRVREGQVVLVPDRHGGLDGHLAAAVQRERRIEGIGLAAAPSVLLSLRGLTISAATCVDPFSLNRVEGGRSLVEERAGTASVPCAAVGLPRGGRYGRRARRTRALSPG